MTVQVEASTSVLVSAIGEQHLHLPAEDLRVPDRASGASECSKDTIPGVAMVPANPRHRSTPRSVLKWVAVVTRRGSSLPGDGGPGVSW